jgi:hypothetical protein
MSITRTVNFGKKCDLCRRGTLVCGQINVFSASGNAWQRATPAIISGKNFLLIQLPLALLNNITNTVSNRIRALSSLELENKPEFKPESDGSIKWKKVITGRDVHQS